MGKGSSRRPTDEDAFKTNYDQIFSKKRPQLEADEYRIEDVEEPYDNELNYTYTEGRVR